MDLLPMCYRCSTTNPLLNPKGNVCVHCGHPFMYSFVSFGKNLREQKLACIRGYNRYSPLASEILPLVEFALDPSISDTEAKDLIAAEPPLEEDKSAVKTALSGRPTANVTEYEPVVFNRSALVSMQRTEVVVCEWPPPLKNRYYVNVIPEISVVRCESCNRLFHTDDYVMHVLQEGKCPFCNKEDDRGSDDEDTLDI